MPKNDTAEILSRPYSRVLIPDSEGRYSARLLEFPGCLADGDTSEEALKNLEEVAESWIESAMAQGMAIPEPFENQGYRGNVALRLPRSLHKRAAEFARRDGVSLNQFLLYAVANLVGAREALDALAVRLDDRLSRLQAPQAGRFLMVDMQTGTGPSQLGGALPGIEELMKQVAPTAQEPKGLPSGEGR